MLWRQGSMAPVTLRGGQLRASGCMRNKLSGCTLMWNGHLATLMPLDWQCRSGPLTL